MEHSLIHSIETDHLDNVDEGRVQYSPSENQVRVVDLAAYRVKWLVTLKLVRVNAYN